MTGQPSPAGRWRIRNLIVWHRPNPPVGALGDKCRPSTSYVTVACVSDKRWFDLDAERTAYTANTLRGGTNGGENHKKRTEEAEGSGRRPTVPGDVRKLTHDGAPPLDAWFDDTPADVWTIPTQPYAGAHYATFPVALPRKLINLMCPRQVCTVCGEPRRRIVGAAEYVDRRGVTRLGSDLNPGRGTIAGRPVIKGSEHVGNASWSEVRTAPTLGWSDCGHDNYRPGLVCDPFGGTGTTALAAALLGRDAVLVDIDPRNIPLARHRIGDHCAIVAETADGPVTTWTVDPGLPGLKGQAEGQLNLFAEGA